MSSGARAALAACLLAASSCTTTTVDVRSLPDGAEVVKISASGGQTVLGTTPLKVDLNALLGEGEMGLHLVVSKADFLDESVLIPKTLLPARHDFVVHLGKAPKLELGQAKPEPNECPALVTQVARVVAEVQGLIASKSYDNAAAKLLIVTNQYPAVSVLQDLLGNVHYLKREYAKALTAYERSLQLEPQNLEASRMVRKVRGMLGIPDQQVGH